MWPTWPFFWFSFLFICHEGRSFIELVILKCCCCLNICMIIDWCTLSSSLHYYLAHNRSWIFKLHSHLFQSLKSNKYFMTIKGGKFIIFFAHCSSISLEFCHSNRACHWPCWLAEVLGGQGPRWSHLGPGFKIGI